MEGVKFTTARRVAEQAVDRVFASLEQTSPPCRTAELPLATAQAEPPFTPGATPGTEAIVHAVREEMAVKLSDVVYRRTDIGAFPGPTRGVVEAAASQMAGELGWELTRQGEEIEAVMREAGAPGPALETVT